MTEDNILQALNTINITLCRLYDVQMALLSLSNPEIKKIVEDTHEDGRFLGAPPILDDNPFDE